MHPIKASVALLLLTTVIYPANQAEGGEGDLMPTVSQWIKPEETGLFECQVVSPEGLDHPLALRGARVEVTGKNSRKAIGITDENGIARIPGIQPGDYTLTVWAEGYVGWQSLHFLAKDDERFGKVPSLALVTPAAVSAEMFQKMAAPYASASIQTEGLKAESNKSENLPHRQVKGAPVTEVFLRSGSLKGQLLCPKTTLSMPEHLVNTVSVENHLVFLIDSSEGIRQTVTDEKGCFSFENTLPGLHSIIVVGRGGIASTRLNAVDVNSTARTNLLTNDGLKFVSKHQPETKFTMEISPNYDDCGFPVVTDGIKLPFVSGGGSGNLIGASLLGTAAVAGTSAYTTATCDSEATDPGGI